MKEDINKINRSNYNKIQKNLLLFLANSYIEKRIDSSHYSVFNDFTNDTEYLNNEIVCILLDDVFKNTLSQSDYVKIISKLAYHNPDTKFTQSMLNSGELFQLVSEDTLEAITTALYNKYPQIPFYMIMYADVICKKKPNDAISICSELIRRLKTRDLTQHLSYANEILRRKSFIYYIIQTSTIAVKKPELGIYMINEFESFINLNDKNSTSYYYYVKAKLFEQYNVDSAKYFYAYSYKLFPQASKVKKDFAIFAKEKLKASNASELLDSLSNSINENFQNLPEELPLLELSDGSKLDLYKSSNPILIYRSSITCSPCKKELKLLYSLKFASAKKPLLLFTNIEHYKYLIKNKLIPKENEFIINGIKNGEEINKAFKLNAEPNTVVIKDNKIVLRNNGYNEKNKDLIYEVISK